jgi:hypothetical protein
VRGPFIDQLAGQTTHQRVAALLTLLGASSRRVELPARDIVRVQ